MKQKFYRKVLKNGMTVMLEKRDIPVVAVSFSVRQGGINESSEEKGISHFIEHMLYKGTPKRNARQIAEEIEKNGGDLNGLTDEIITMYYCKMPSKHLDIALNVLSDMVKNPKFDETEMEKEKKVIFEEMKLYKDNPTRHVYEKIQGNLYAEPFGKNLIGDEKTVGSIDRKKILSVFKRIYNPNNMILCVVGDADFDKLVSFAEKNFGSEKGEIKEFKINKINKSGREKRKGIDQANLIFAYHVPLFGTNGGYAAKLLSVLMGGGLSSRLFTEIREKRNLAYAVKGVSDIHKDYAYSIVYVGTTKEKVEEVKELIIKEYENVANSLTQKELDEIKVQIIGNHNISMEDSVNQMLGLTLYEIDGNAQEFYEFEKRISDVTLDDVKELAKSATKNYSFFALIPE